MLKQLRGKGLDAWDGGSSHEWPAARQFLARNKRLRLGRMPA